MWSFRKKKPEMKLPEDLTEAVEALRENDALVLQVLKGVTPNPIPIGKEEIEIKDEDHFVSLMHHSLGRWIRNTFGLWNKEAPLCKWFKERGFTHADDMSTIVLFAFYRRVHGTKEMSEETMGLHAADFKLYWMQQGVALDG